MAALIRYETPLPGPWPGSRQVGEIEIRPGMTVPLYDTEPPADGPSINTPEGWNALAERMRNRENGLHA